MNTSASRSHWAWGWQDRLLDDTALTNFGKLVGGMLGFPVQNPEAATPLAGATLAGARLAPPDTLANRFDATPFQRALHAYGRAYPDVVRGFRGDYATAPDMVAFPETAAEVAQILDWASATNVAVVPFGGGTSVVRGVELEAERHAAHPAVVSLDLTRMDRVLHVDTESLSAHIQGGASGPVLNRQLAEHGLVLRHYPQSYEFATLGGMIATRSGGHFATVYTHIDEFVQALHTQAPRGPIESWRLPGSGAGPSPDRMIIGSEGTLGVITSAWMRLRRRPVWRSSATLHFDAFRDAVTAARLLAQSQLSPSNCRVLDAREAGLHQVSRKGKAVLLVAFESAEHPVKPLMDLALELIADCGGALPSPPKNREERPGDAAASNDASADKWRNAFVDMPYLQSNLVRLGVLADTFETACTWSGFEALHADVIKTVRTALKASSPSGRGFLSCRFTHVYPDGPAPYYTFICPARRGDEVAQWMDIKAAASEVLAKHQATITHHHAVGRTHRLWANRQRPDLFTEVLQGAKQTLDPAGILNPGVVFDPAIA